MLPNNDYKSSGIQLNGVPIGNLPDSADPDDTDYSCLFEITRKYPTVVNISAR